MKEEDGKFFLVVIGLGDVMETAEDSINCSTVFSSSHLFIVEEVRCFYQKVESGSDDLF